MKFLSNTLRYEKDCVHEWVQTQEEELKKHEPKVAACLRNLLSCKNCKQVKFVGQVDEQRV